MYTYSNLNKLDYRKLAMFQAKSYVLYHVILLYSVAKTITDRMIMSIINKKSGHKIYHH